MRVCEEDRSERERGLCAVRVWEMEEEERRFEREVRSRTVCLCDVCVK